MLALNKKTGKEEWRYEFPLFSWSTPTLLTDEDGHAWLLHGGIGGVVRLLEARTGLESVDWASTPSTQEALARALKALGRK